MSIVLPFVHRFNMDITGERRSRQQIANGAFSGFKLQCLIQREYACSYGLDCSLKFNTGAAAPITFAEDSRESSDGSN